MQTFETVLLTEQIAPWTHYYLASLHSMRRMRGEAYEHLTLAIEQGFKDFKALNSSNLLEFLRSQPDYGTFVKNGYQFPPSRSISEDVITKLERLGKLKHDGLITEEEFIEQKQKLLTD